MLEGYRAGYTNYSNAYVRNADALSDKKTILSAPAQQTITSSESGNAFEALLELSKSELWDQGRGTEKEAAEGTEGAIADREQPLEKESESTAQTGSKLELSEDEKEQVRELQARDQEVRAHENAHAAAAGPYRSGGPTYVFQQGPDGRQYAVGGEVQIDTSPENEPQATVIKMQIVQRAALAPAEPSAQDRAVAAAAAATAAAARQQLAEEQLAEAEENRPDISPAQQPLNAAAERSTDTDSGETMSSRERSDNPASERKERAFFERGTTENNGLESRQNVSDSNAGRARETFDSNETDTMKYYATTNKGQRIDLVA